MNPEVGFAIVDDRPKAGTNRHLKRSDIGIDHRDDSAPHGQSMTVIFYALPIVVNQLVEPQPAKLEQGPGADSAMLWGSPLTRSSVGRMAWAAPGCVSTLWQIGSVPVIRRRRLAGPPAAATPAGSGSEQLRSGPADERRTAGGGDQQMTKQPGHRATLCHASRG